MSGCRLSERLVHEVIGRIENGSLKRMKFAWLELTGCSGNIISLLNGEDPDFIYLVTSMVDIIYDNSIMTEQGERAIERLMSLENEPFVLAVEGAASMKDKGAYTMIGRYKGQAITGIDALKMLGEKAQHVIAVGACATHGGISGAAPNPSGSVGIQEVLSRRVIKLPGCPCHPDWFTGTLAHVLLYGGMELDSMDRPVLFYGETIHDRCQRRSFFEKGIFASKLGESTCMFKLGCRGPVTRVDCPVRQWNGYVNWPVKDNTPCIGCAQFGFPDKMEPFISFNTLRGEEACLKK